MSLGGKDIRKIAARTEFSLAVEADTGVAVGESRKFIGRLA
jgi:hypothetical protein